MDTMDTEGLLYSLLSGYKSVYLANYSHPGTEAVRQALPSGY